MNSSDEGIVQWLVRDEIGRLPLIHFYLFKSVLPRVDSDVRQRWVYALNLSHLSWRNIDV
jgi:hypothetical protein